MSLTALNQLLSEKFPGLFGEQNRDPRYRFFHYRKVRYCWNTQPMASEKRPFACWNEREKKIKGGVQVRRTKIAFFTKRKVAKARALQRFRLASSKNPVVGPTI